MSRATSRKAPREVAIVPHTHWDREWYAPFQTFRLRLVELLDGLLPAMEADPSYAHFLLDGQMAVIDDYLEVRPGAEAALVQLAEGGRLAMGPWYVLMDEFLVSGETVVRNLQLGLERAGAFGGAMEVGYLPDMFGHVAQMPQVLAQAGFDHAVVWRGVPASVTATAFVWQAPDGSAVRAEYLPGGYGHGADVPDDAGALVGLIAATERDWGDRLADGPLLWMNGTDHQLPQPYLGRVVAEANAMQDDYRLCVGPLAEHLADHTTDGLTVVTGELRSGARANLLMGVTSNRVDIRRRAAAAERALERRAEPLCALFTAPDDWPQAMLDLAWLEVIRNSAHDSVCACSADEVCDAVSGRYASARQVADGLADRGLAALTASLEEAGAVIVNVSARPRSGVIEVDVPGGPDGGAAGTQVVARRAGTLLDRTVAGRDLAQVIGPIRSQQFSPGTYIHAWEVQEADDEVCVTFRADDRMHTDLVFDEVKAGLLALAAERPGTPFRVRVVQPPFTKVLARVEHVAGFGWQTWRPSGLSVGGVEVDGWRMANGLVTVEVDPDDGSFSVDGSAGFDRLVDGGDHGDTYNYNPPDTDTVVDRPEAVVVEVAEAGPVRGCLVVTRTYSLPERIDDEARARVGCMTVEVRTTIEVRAGERLVRVTTELDHHIRDHRLRAHFPLPSPTATSVAECSFATVERGTTAEGGPTEAALPTFPSRRFVQAGGLTVVHDGVAEYELVELDGEDGRARALAITLVRATGMLSRIEMANRPLPAGPPLPLEGAQVQGRLVSRYGVAVGDVDPWALADDLLLPLEVVDAAGGGSAPADGAALTVTGAEVSAVQRRAGALEVRVFNPGPEPTTVALAGHAGWLVDLRGRPVEPFDRTFTLRPWGIATAQLADG